MPVPKTAPHFLEMVRQSGLLDPDGLTVLAAIEAQTDPGRCAAELVKAGLLTAYQAKQLLVGRYRGFFLGPYKLLRPLGRGGMGAVYLAEHTALNRKVAIKVLPADKAKDELNRERFQREGRAAAALDHPNIVRVHDICQSGGVPFLVLEHVDGVDLQSLVNKSGALPFPRAADYVSQAAAGLQHAHDRGFIHRDIKPANLMLTPGGDIKILDMGLARSCHDSKDQLTGNLSKGDIAGTVDFLSPEQAMNHPLDRRSDIYSLGATFFALLTGHPPFSGNTTQKLMQHQMKPPPSAYKLLNGQIPYQLSDIITRMMAKRPADRFQSASGVIQALDPWLPTAESEAGAEQAQSFATPVPVKKQSSTRSLRPLTTSHRLHIPPISPPRTRHRRSRTVAVSGVVLVLLAGLVTAVAAGRAAHTPSSLAVAGATPDAAVVNQRPLGPGRTVYRLDASRLEPFQLRFDTNEAYNGANITGEVPGWQYQVFDPTSVGEVKAERVDGRAVLSIGSRKGKNTAQFTFMPGRVSGLRLHPGQEYEVRVEYQNTCGVGGFAGVQTVGDWLTVGQAKLSADTREWTTATYFFTFPAGKEVQLTFGVDAVDDGWLSIRALEIIDHTSSESTSPN